MESQSWCLAAELLCFAAVDNEGKKGGTSGKKLLHCWEGYRSWSSLLPRCCQSDLLRVYFGKVTEMVVLYERWSWQSSAACLGDWRSWAWVRSDVEIPGHSLGFCSRQLLRCSQSSWVRAHLLQVTTASARVESRGSCPRTDTETRSGAACAVCLPACPRSHHTGLWGTPDAGAVLQTVSDVLPGLFPT